MAKQKTPQKPKKERADNYEEKLKVKASFQQLLNWTVEGNPKPKKDTKNK